MMKKILRFATIALGVLSMCLLITACGSQEVNTSNEGQPPSGDESGEGEGHPVTDEEREEWEVLQPERGDTLPWVDGSLLVYIPPGEFAMGNEEGEGNNPRHPVYLDGFWIYRTEVTYGMYLNCMAKEKCGPPEVDPAIENIEDPALADFPMVNIRWDQAASYCEWVGGFLPTEAQWEKAARGFESYPFPWGEDKPNCELLNYNNCVGETTPVYDYTGSASPFEVYDMAGNVFEWVADWYNEEYYYAASFDNPMGPGGGETKVVRGSSYMSNHEMAPLFNRYAALPEEYSLNLGFRCVVARAEEYAPQCEVLAYVPPDGGENPDAPPSGEASCIVPQPDITYTTYCEKGERRNNISWSPADADVNYSPLEGAWCQGYDKDTIICGGPAGAMVDMTACKFCPPPAVELGIPAKCDPPYVRDDASGLCRYDGPKVPKVVCAPGFSLNADRSCCEMVDFTPWDFPICAMGGRFDPTSGICWFTLPSTGDEKCDKERVYFSACVKEGGRSGSGGTGGASCSQYGNEDDCESNGCTWGCMMFGDGMTCTCKP